MACCLEIVLFAYSSPRTFPWIIEVLDLQPFYFYKVRGLQSSVMVCISHINTFILMLNTIAMFIKHFGGILIIIIPFEV